MATSKYGANAGQIANNYNQWESQNIDAYNKLQELQSSTNNDIIRNIPLIGTPAQAAVDSFLSTIGGIADYAGNPSGIGDSINEYVTAHEIAMGEKPEASFSWDYFMNGLARDTGGLVGSMASLAIPTLAAAAAAPALGVSLPVAAAAGGVIGAGGEALAEGGSKLRESLTDGDSLDTAQDKARSVAGKNFAMLAPLNLLELGTFAKVGQGIKSAYKAARGAEGTARPSALGNLLKGTGTTGAGALNEGYQEYVQEGIQSSVEPNEYYSYIPGYGNEQQNEAFASTIGPMLMLGGLGGGARIAAGKLGHYAKPDQISANDIMEGTEAQTMPMSIPAQANYTIANEVSDANLSQGTESKLRMLDDAYYKQYGQHLYVTSMTRHWGTNSDHETGSAFDVADDGLANDSERRRWVEEKARQLGLNPLDEYENPSSGATGGHMHFSDKGGAVNVDTSGWSGNVDIDNLINENANKYGISANLLAAIAEQESNFNQNAQSGAGALGIMQLMPDTAQGLGVDPSDLAGNIEGGAKYIKQMLDRFDGDIHKALEAYNGGPGGIGTAETIKYADEVMQRYEKFKTKSAGTFSWSKPSDTQTSPTDYMKIMSDNNVTADTAGDFLQYVQLLSEDEVNANNEQVQKDGAKAVKALTDGSPDVMERVAKELGYGQVKQEAEQKAPDIPMPKIKQHVQQNGWVEIGNKKDADEFAKTDYGKTLERVSNTKFVSPDFNAITGKVEQRTPQPQQIAQPAPKPAVQNTAKEDIATTAANNLHTSIPGSASALANILSKNSAAVSYNGNNVDLDKLNKAIKNNNIGMINGFNAHMMKNMSKNGVPLDTVMQEYLPIAKDTARKLSKIPDVLANNESGTKLDLRGLQNAIDNNDLNRIVSFNERMSEILQQKGISPYLALREMENERTEHTENKEGIETTPIDNKKNINTTHESVSKPQKKVSEGESSRDNAMAPQNASDGKMAVSAKNIEGVTESELKEAAKEDGDTTKEIKKERVDTDNQIDMFVPKYSRDKNVDNNASMKDNDIEEYSKLSGEDKAVVDKEVDKRINATLSRIADYVQAGFDENFSADDGKLDIHELLQDSRKNEVLVSCIMKLNN